ncbi:MAG: hypothetical protein FJZ98_07065 [Chloroflexi bacterium]|nr:hypothetical protein [Chloroflexota bacterium]
MPDADSLKDYVDSVNKSYTQVLFSEGNLKPFLLNRNEYDWVLFDVDLEPGNYRLCLLQTTEWKLRPVTAYAVVFPPGMKPIKHAETGQFGSGFNILPATSIGNKFLFSRNLTDLTTRFQGLHQVGVTTKFWTPDVENISFEVALLRKNPPVY